MSIQARCEIENTVGMVSQGDYLLHARVLLDNDLVLTVSVG
jgi:hypothetical protein